MATYQITAPDGKTYRINGPDGASQQDVVNAVIAQHPMAGQTTQQLQEEPSAPFSASDLARSFGTGAVGTAKSFADVFGADSGISKYLGQAQQSLQAGISPERQREMTRDAELIERAKKEGLGSEALANIKSVLHAPLQSAAGLAGGVLPFVAGTVALPEEAVVAGGMTAAELGNLGFGAVSGLGGAKGAMFDRAKAEALKQGKSEAEANKIAEQAQAYSLQNAPAQAGSTVIGGLMGSMGAPSVATKALKKSVSPEGAFIGEKLEQAIAALPEKERSDPTFLRALYESIRNQAPLGAAQSAVEQYGGNVAAQQAGADVTPGEGVAGSALQGATTGLLGGALFAPLHQMGMKGEYQSEQFLRNAKREQELDKAKTAALLKQQQERQKTESELGVPKMLALPAPARDYVPPADPLQDPVGRITRNELGNAIGDDSITNYIDQYRAANNMPALKTFSVEDIKDAMTAMNPEGEQGALNSILAYKTGYKGEEYKPEDVLKAAQAKSIATGTKGWDDYLKRAAGSSDLETMEQPQLHSVIKALDGLNRTESQEPLVLPEGSNASRFNKDQYEDGLTHLNMVMDEKGGPVLLNTARQAIKDQLGLKTDRDAEHFLRTAAANDDLSLQPGTAFQATKGDKVLGVFATEEEAKKSTRKAEINPVDAQFVVPREEPKTERRAALPEGYDIQKNVVEGDQAPAGFAIRQEDSQKNIGDILLNEDAAKAKLEALQASREKLAASEEAKADAISADIERKQKALTDMEAAGQTGTPDHAKAARELAVAKAKGSDQMVKHMDQAQEYRKPIKIVSLGKKATPRETHTITKDGKKLGTFKSREEAERQLLSQLSDEELAKVASDTRHGGITDRAKQEQYQRGLGDYGRGITKSPPDLSEEFKAKADEIGKQLMPILSKLGLKNVALEVASQIKKSAEGSYFHKLIQVAIDAKEPVRVMRHESLHAMRDLGFFTDEQWNALTRQADKVWIDKYLKDPARDVEVDGQKMSRYDGYKYLGQTEPAEWNKANPDKPQRKVMTDAELKDMIREEAIADAFADFDANKAPPGMLAALLNKIKSFFEALRNSFNEAGFQTAEDVFKQAEAGKLKGREETGGEEKLSLSGIGTPYSTRDIMEKQTPVVQQELGLSTEAKRGRFNSVRQIATALNDFTRTHFGAMNEGDLTSREATQIAKAIADEVGYQLKTTAKTGTGKGWYSENYPNAVKMLANRFPELGTSPHARSVFSAIVAVTSNGEKVAKNIANAIKLYSKLRDGKLMVAMNNRRGTALVNNLKTIHELLNRHGKNFEKELLREITVKDMNAELRARGEKPDNSYQANTTVPAAAIYFGPKLGAFYANLSGAEGYLTMDLWWTRSINRMRGLLMPKATESSISKFRDIMDRPDATRDEVVAATIPLRDKYKEYGYTTELEHLAGSKEPRTNDKKVAWFKQAEEKAGDAYEQLLFDHNAEKMANTIYKNEYEMLEEAPFNAGDRKFMYDAARQAQKMLSDEGVDLSLADVQAALWYYEKRLYEKLSGRKADDIGYEEAIIEQSKQGAGRVRPSVVFDREYGGGAESGGESEKADRLRGQPAFAQPDEGVSNEPKYSLGRGKNERVEFVGPSYDERKLGAAGVGRRSESRRYAPLEDAPSVKGFSGPDPSIVEVAEQYAKENGLEHNRQREYVQVDEDRARRIANEYENMKHDPQDPKVKAAYDDLIKQTTAQYHALEKAGYKFWFTDLNKQDNLEYLSSPWNALRDMRENKQMGIFPTDEGFGSGEFDPRANPLLQNTGLKWPVGSPDGPLKPVLANDLFRAVHDAFGHGLEGAGFRARGEENAWQAHARMFTGDALGALTSETRGQNSWLNYGPHGEKNRTAKIEDTVFADQKTGLMPEWTWHEGFDDGKKFSLKFAEPALKPIPGNGVVLGEKQKDAESFVGLHYGQNKVAELSGSKYGTGIKGAERRRLAETDDNRIKKRIYFYIPKEDGSMPRQESGLGGHVYTQQFDNIAAGKEVDRLFAKAGGDANQFESNVVDAGYDGYAMPNMGMMVILNHDAPVEYHGTMGELAESGKKLSLRTHFPSAEEAEDAAYQKAPPSTPEFKRFFGGSKVKEEGRPQVMYHGSPDIFETFNDSKPIFVTPEPEFAEQFGQDRAKDLGRSPDDAKVYPLWVRAETPFDYENPDHVAKVADKIIADQNLTKPDSVVRLKQSSPKVSKFREEVADGLWSVIEDPVVQSALKTLGFDSFHVQEGGNKNLAVFNANQVKSVTGNIGDFGENKDIRFSLPTVSAAAKARRDETTSARVEEGWVARVTDAFKSESMSDLRAKLVHRYNRFGEYETAIADRMYGGVHRMADVNAEAAANMSDLSASITASVFGIGNRKGGIPVLKNGFTTTDTSVKSPLETLKPLAQFGKEAYQDYQFWAGVKRGTRLDALGKEKNFDAGDRALAKEYFDGYKAKGVDFDQIHKELNDFNNGIVKYMVDAGVISPEMGKEYTKYADYIPFYRQMDGEKTHGPKVFNNLSGVKPPKKLKGGEAPLGDFLENLVRNTQSAINAGMKNVAMQKALDAALMIGDISGAERLNGIHTEPDTVQVLEKGKQVSYRVADQLFINACKSLNMGELPFMGLIAAPSNLLRNMVTKDPGFMLANLARDSLAAWVTSGTDATPIIGTFGNFIKALGGKNKNMEAILNAGILGGYEFSSGVLKSGKVLEADLQKKYGKPTGAAALLKPFTSVWDALEHGTEASDAATRTAIYERVMQETGNEAEALYRSLEVMNFNRKGSSALIRILTAAVPFLNARIQGLDVFYRTAMGKNVMNNNKAMQKAFFVRGMTLMALSAAYYLAVKDDPEWKKQEQETKDNNWILPGVGKFPTPFEVGFLFKTIPERILAYTMGEDTGQDLSKSLYQGLQNNLQLTPSAFIPQAVKPLVEWNTNYSFFTGRPIVGQGMQGVADKYQVGPSTSKTAAAIGEATGLSPLKLDQFINGYTGTMGTYGVMLIDKILDAQGNSPSASKRFEQLPIIKRFAADPEARGNISQYYELKNAVDTVVQTENLLLKSARPEEYAKFVQDNAGLLANRQYVSDIEKEMKRFREMRKTIQSSDMSSDEKRDMLTAIGQGENNLVQNIQSVKKAISEI